MARHSLPARTPSSTVQDYCRKGGRRVAIDDEIGPNKWASNRRRTQGAARDQLKERFFTRQPHASQRAFWMRSDDRHSFDLPQGMVDAEFDNIWKQVEAELKREGASPEDEGKTEDEMKAEYRGHSERRVRSVSCGEGRRANAITISQDE